MWELAPLIALTSLQLRYCNGLCNEGATALAMLTALTYLDLRYCNELTSEGLRALVPLTALTWRVHRPSPSPLPHPPETLQQPHADMWMRPTGPSPLAASLVANQLPRANERERRGRWPARAPSHGRGAALQATPVEVLWVEVLWRWGVGRSAGSDGLHRHPLPPPSASMCRWAAETCAWGAPRLGPFRRSAPPASPVSDADAPA
jgi:hypothetical protein